MVILYIVAGIAVMVYVAGCIVANGLVTSEEAASANYTRLDVLGYTLGSWGTVMASALGRIQ